MLSLSRWNIRKLNLKDLILVNLDISIEVILLYCKAVTFITRHYCHWTAVVNRLGTVIHGELQQDPGPNKTRRFHRGSSKFEFILEAKRLCTWTLKFQLSKDLLVVTVTVCTCV